MQAFLFALCQAGVKGNIAKLVGMGQPKVRKDRGREQKKNEFERCRRCPLSGAFPGGNYTPLALGCVERARCRTRLRYLSTGARFMVDCCLPFAIQEAFLLGEENVFIRFVSNSSCVLTVFFCVSFRDRFVCPLPASVGMTSVGMADGGIFDRFLSSRTPGGKGAQPVRGPGRAIRRGTGEGAMKVHRKRCGVYCSMVS